MPLDKPCASVSTLESMAYNMPYFHGIACCVMDARCSQIYNALFMLGKGNVERITADRALSINELLSDLEYYDDDIYLVGDGASICYNAYSGKLDNIILVPENIRYQRAYGTAKAAERLACHNGLCTSAALQPLYLRLPQAERELKAKLAQQKSNW